MRKLRIGTCLLVVVAGAGTVQAEPPTPTHTERAAAAFRRQAASGEALPFARLAQERPQDAWPIAGWLCDDGAPDLAAELARVAAAAVPKEHEHLPTYVTRRANRPVPPDVRERLRRARAALVDGRSQEVLRLTDGDVHVEDPVCAYDINMLRGLALEDAGRPSAAGDVFEQASLRASEAGFRLGAAATMAKAGSLAGAAGDRREAIRRFELEYEIEIERGDRVEAAMVLRNIGIMLRLLGDLDGAASMYGRALEGFQEVGHEPWMGRMLHHLGCVDERRGRLDDAARYFEGALDVAERVGDVRLLVDALRSLGVVALNQQRYEDAVGHYARALQTLGSDADPADAVRLEVDRALAWVESGHVEAARHAATSALEEAERLGLEQVVVDALEVLALAEQYEGRIDRAVELWERRLRLAERQGDAQGLAKALLQLARGQVLAGQVDAADAALTRCAGLPALPPAYDRTSRMIGAWIAERRADYARALALAEPLVEEPDTAEDAERLLGRIFLRLGDHALALAHYRRAWALAEERGQAEPLAARLETEGIVQFECEAYEEARGAFARVVVLRDEAGDESGAAHGRVNLGNALARLGRGDEARSAYEEALVAFRGFGARTQHAWVLCRLAELASEAGRTQAAIEKAAEALSIAHAAGAGTVEIQCLNLLARNHFQREEYDLAVEAARLAIARAPDMTGGLGPSQMASLREDFRSAYAYGTSAALGLGDWGQAFSFAEVGRSGALLDALRAADLSDGQSLAEPWAEREAQARADVTRATEQLREAVAERQLRRIRSATVALETVRADYERLVDQISRQVRGSVRLPPVPPVTVQEVQATLTGEDRYVLYVLLYGDAVAFVVQEDDVRVHVLGPEEAILAAARRVRQAGENPAVRDAKAALAELKELVVAPLGLDASVRRVLISPHGLLATAPWPSLLPNRDVLLLPSARVWFRLRDREPVGGRRVLALGDPEYGTRNRSRSRGVSQALLLSPLPATEGEARAVGTTVLLGAHATEGRLRAAAAEEGPWRAIHLACHGILDPERPLFSALAVTADAEDDGFLTALELCRQSWSTDLVVLSACETARGRALRSEGLLGLPRALLQTGARGVLGSLWKVDDDATAALMRAFYDRWCPPDPEVTPLPAAQALRAAQEAVRNDPDHPEWEHPHYWAAWVLWGLGD